MARAGDDLHHPYAELLVDHDHLAARDQAAVDQDVGRLAASLSSSMIEPTRSPSTSPIVIRARPSLDGDLERYVEQQVDAGHVAAAALTTERRERRHVDLAV